MAQASAPKWEATGSCGIALAPSDSKAIWVATGEGNEWVNRAAAPAWTRIRNGKAAGPGEGERSFDGWIQEITTDESVAAASRAYVAIGDFRWGHRF